MAQPGVGGNETMQMYYQAMQCEGDGGKYWLAAAGMMLLTKEILDDEVMLGLLGLMGQYEYSRSFYFLPSI